MLNFVLIFMCCIDFCLSIASVSMGALHLNECQNQAATFLIVNGCITLVFALIVLSFILLLANKEDLNLIRAISYFLPLLPKLGLSIYGSIVIFAFGEYETQLKAKIIDLFVSGSSIDNCHGATFIFAYVMFITNLVTTVGFFCVGCSIFGLFLLCMSFVPGTKPQR